MSHRFYAGKIFHKRFEPKQHQFTYDYFFLDIDLACISTLQNGLMGLNRMGVMSFLSKDHFGKNGDFQSNVSELAQHLGWENEGSIRFLTLPRILNFVFNPISLLIKLDSNSKPTHMVAEVHNYNGGRVLYPVTLRPNEKGLYAGSSSKTMYVSPFMDYDGEYHFELDYTSKSISLNVTLTKNGTDMLIASFCGNAMEYSTKAIRKILCGHTFFTLFVVTRTLYQSFKLKLKGLRWYAPRSQDQLKKELT